MHWGGGGSIARDQRAAPGVLGAFSKVKAATDGHCGELVIGDGELSCVGAANAIV